MSARHLLQGHKAANWIQVGQSTWRGKKCPVHQPIVPIKGLWLYSLRRDFASALDR